MLIDQALCLAVHLQLILKKKRKRTREEILLFPYEESEIQRGKVICPHQVLANENIRIGTKTHLTPKP